MEVEDVGNSFDAASSELIEIKVNCDLFFTNEEL